MTLLRYSLRNIAATRIRFALTALAVVMPGWPSPSAC